MGPLTPMDLTPSVPIFQQGILGRLRRREQQPGLCVCIWEGWGRGG